MHRRRRCSKPRGDAPADDGHRGHGAAGGRGFLLVGSRQERLGERWTATLWESGDAAFWAEPPPNGALAEGVSSTASGGVWLSQELVIVGGVTTDTSRAQPAVWSAPDGWTFGPSVDPYGFPGYVAAATSGPAGLVVGGYGVDPVLGHSYPVAALRTEAGWVATNLPLPSGAAGWVEDLAANNSAVVATGSIDDRTAVQAAVWMSSDGGRTFIPGDASAAHVGLGSRLGAAVTTPTGFAALACTARGPTPTTALMTSADGLGWQRVEIVATDSSGEPFPNVDADCSSLTTDGDRLLVGAVEGRGGHVLAIGLDGRGDDLYAPRGSGSLATEAPLAVRRPDGAIGAVDRETRGFAAGLAKHDDRPDGAGLPTSRTEIVTIGVDGLVDHLLTRVVRFPIVTDRGDGYGWKAATVWSTSSGLDEWEPAGRADVPRDTRLVRSGNGVDVAFATSSDDPADAHLAGPGGGTVGWVRGAGGAWEPTGLLASGPGGDYIFDVLALPGGGFVAAGEATIADERGATTTTPITMASADGRSSSAEPHPPAGDQTSVSQLCPMPGGGVLAVGSTIVDGTSLLYLLRRDAAGIWSEVDRSAFPPEVDWFPDCDIVGGKAVLVARPDRLPVAYTSADGVTFTPVTLDVPGASRASVNALALVGEELYGAGSVTMGVESTDAALWRTSDGAAWDRVPVEGLDGLHGVGEQDALDVAAAPTGDVVLAGFDRGQVVTWTVTPPP